MNDQQQHLLKLLKEIDGICRKNNIEYFTAGGTVIGAARHRGFIPWDDDVDIYMTKDSFEAFRQAFKENPPQDRKLEYIKDNPEFYATIPRYNEETTTQICRYHVLGKASGGLLIDILIMDEFPDDDEARHEYLAKLNVYADMVALPYTHAQRNEDCYLDFYNEYMKKVKTFGRKKVMEELEKELFNFPADHCGCYILRWAALPIILPKEMMGKPVYLPFEDMEIPVPQRWFQYLTLLYGPDWVNVPSAEGQETHIAVSSMEVPYKFFMNERDKYISQKEAYETYMLRKKRSVALQYVRRPIEKYILDVKCRLALDIYRKKIASRRDEIKKLFNAGEYGNVAEIFQPYTARQTSTLFAGKLKHAHWNRWMNPVILEIDEDDLKTVLYSLVMSGNCRAANQIVSAYFRAGRATDTVRRIYAMIHKINEAEEAYYLKEYVRCMELVASIEDFQHNKKCRDLYWLSRAVADKNRATGTELKELISSGIADTEIQKAYGDWLYETGEKERAEEIYADVMKNTRNGMFWLDIHDKTSLTPDLAGKRELILSAEEQREKEMLLEINRICAENGIKYVFSNKLAFQALQNGNLGHFNGQKTIYMDTENCLLFIEAFEKENPADRNLLSWKNDDRLLNMKLVYNDTSSVYARLDRLKVWQGIGIHINIVILRNKSNKLRDRLILLREIILNVANLDTVDLCVINTKTRKILYNLAVKMVYRKGKRRFASDLFDDIIKREKKLSGKSEQLYCRKNRTKGIYTDNNMPKDFLEQTDIVSLEGIDYPISSTAKKIRRLDIPDGSEESLFFYMSCDTDWDEMNEVIDLDRYYSFDWKEYGRSRRALSKVNKKVKKMWQIMKRSEDKLNLYNYYRENIKDLRRSFEEKDEERISELLYPYEEKFFLYRRSRLTFYINRELNEMFETYLESTGRHKLAQKVRKLKETCEDDGLWDFDADGGENVLSERKC